MKSTVNHVRNPQFQLGKVSPRHWEAKLDPSTCEFHRLGQVSGDSAGIVLVPQTPAPAFWWQTLRCKPGAFYRVEALVRCELVPAGPSPGFVLVLEYAGAESDQFVRLESRPIFDAPDPVDVRTYFHAPDWCSQAIIGVGVRNAVGLVEIQDVRFIRILEPDEMSHPHAIQSPFVPAPPPVASVCICSNGASQRPLCTMLGLALGKDQISHIPLKELGSGVTAEAVLLPDAEPPAALRSLGALFELAAEKLVVISLPVFAGLTRGTLSVRRIEQSDDPIHAKVVYANNATRGFALHDCFAFAWPGRTPSSFAQNQFRKNEKFDAFCKKHKFKTLLVSNCDKDATSDRPICLYCETAGGGLYILDLNPVESPASTLSEPTLAAHLLLSILRRSPAPAGQFTVPVRKEVQLRDMIREAANRWDHIYVHDDDVPSEEVTHQIVTLGREDEMYGLPVVSKPVILIRSGLFGGDSQSVFGVWAWLKQLLLHSRHSTSYAADLSARFRLAWVPSAAAWEPCDGWSASGAAPFTSTEVELEESQVAAVIDVRTGMPGQLRVVFAQPTSAFHRAEMWLPLLHRAFAASEFPTIACGAGNGSGSRRPNSWQLIRHEISVIAEAGAFDEPIHREVLAQGGNAIRIELPSFESDSVASSIHHSHVAVSVLEQTIGLHYGLIAVNRTRNPVLLDGLGLVPPGESMVLDHEAAIMPLQATCTG